MNGPCYIQNLAVTNRVIKRSGCIWILLKMFFGNSLTLNKGFSSEVFLNFTSASGKKVLADKNIYFQSIRTFRANEYFLWLIPNVKCVKSIIIITNY